MTCPSSTSGLPSVRAFIRGTCDASSNLAANPNAHLM